MQIWICQQTRVINNDRARCISIPSEEGHQKVPKVLLRGENFKYLGEKPQSRVQHEQRTHSTIGVESGMQWKWATLIEDRFSYKSIIWAPPDPFCVINNPFF